MNTLIIRIILCGVFSISLISCNGTNIWADKDKESTYSDPNKPQQYSVTITRTAGGIPHIKASDLGSLGFGTLYAMAEDNICIMAEHYRMLAAEQSLNLGPDDGRLISDLFYQLLKDRGNAKQASSPELEVLFTGSAAGYNAYLNEVGAEGLPDQRCRGQVWVKPITALDVKRVSRVDTFLDYMKPIIVAAQPPEINPLGAHDNSVGVGITAGVAAEINSSMLAALTQYLEVPKQGGSNAIAIGGNSSASAQAMLLANPHMPWHAKFQRFYPMHQTIPGKLDIMGANLIGRPRVGFGTTEHLAWTSTVSKAKRMTFYRLALVPGKPDHYWFDGKETAMTKERVSIKVKNADGRLEDHTHVFYSTHFGGLLVKSDFFGWDEQHAFAVRTIDPAWRGEVSAFAQYQAKTVRELRDVHNQYQFLMVNLIAADSSGEVLYTEPGPVPNISDTQLSDCAVLGGAAFDGTRSDCQWSNDGDTAAPGILNPDKLPVIYRKDYVTNSNDSYWLANPDQPLEGYGLVLGEEASSRTLRTRSGLNMVQRLLASDDNKISLAELTTLTLANENYAGQLIRDDLVGFCQQKPIVFIEQDGSDKPLSVNLTDACRVLAQWDLYSNLDSRGAHLFREFLASANNYEYSRYLPKSFKMREPFNITKPVSTPLGLAAESEGVVLDALAKAVIRLQQAGIALDAELGSLQSVTRNGKRIPIHGGQEIEGVFNKVEADFVAQRGYPEVSRWSSSWIMATAFTEDGPLINALLAYSLSSNPDSPYYFDQTELFSNKQWLTIPFKQADIDAAAIRTYTLQGSSAANE